MDMIVPVLANRTEIDIRPGDIDRTCTTAQRMRHVMFSGNRAKVLTNSYPETRKRVRGKKY